MEHHRNMRVFPRQTSTGGHGAYRGAAHQVLGKNLRRNSHEREFNEGSWRCEVKQSYGSQQKHSALGTTTLLSSLVDALGSILILYTVIAEVSLDELIEVVQES
ncbi:hypothetical protein RRG08_052054 [Elysia crispata]|uniref:Uncharacterized protein n=1 Tax=Elysia crispata TaxID=231223 RepID=A0AAE1A607_9GAST|nr:hypothetical protein RRG08_052054 [Elysia crispata]